MKNNTFLNIVKFRWITRKAVLYALLSCFLFIIVGNIAKVHASFGYVGNDYPYQNADPSKADPTWGNFYYRNCTDYVAWRMNRDAGITNTSAPQYFLNTMTGPNGTTQHWSDASNWKNAALAMGFKVDTNPVPGDIAWWSYGHVAYVESVNSNGTVNISQYNNQNDYAYHEYPNQVADDYIHVESGIAACGNSYANISGSVNLTNISTPIACTAKNTINIYPETVINANNGDVSFTIH